MNSIFNSLFGQQLNFSTSLSDLNFDIIEATDNFSLTDRETYSVSFKLPQGINQDDIKVDIDDEEYYLKVEYDYTSNDGVRHTYSYKTTVPYNVNFDSCDAVIKDNTLQINFSKLN